MARACGPSGPQWCAQYAWRLRPETWRGLAFAVLARLAGQVYSSSPAPPNMRRMTSCAKPRLARKRACLA